MLQLTVPILQRSVIIVVFEQYIVQVLMAHFLRDSTLLHQQLHPLCDVCRLRLPDVLKELCRRRPVVHEYGQQLGDERFLDNKIIVNLGWVGGIVGGVVCWGVKVLDVFDVIDIDAAVHVNGVGRILLVHEGDNLLGTWTC